MKNCSLLERLNQETQSYINNTIHEIANNYHLSETQTAQVLQFHKTLVPASFQQLYSSSMLRCDCPKYAQIVDEINERIHRFFETKTPLIQEIMVNAKNNNSIEEEQQLPSQPQQISSQPQQLSQQQSQQLSQQQIPQQPSQQQLSQLTQIQQITQIPPPTPPTQQTQIEIHEDPQIILQIKKKYHRPRIGPSTKDAKCESCVCQGTSMQGDLILCQLCLNYLHLPCLGNTYEGYKTGFVCPPCVLKYMDHFNKVKKVLIYPSPFRTESQINHKPFQFICDQSIIDIRCIRMENKISAEEITWPDLGELFLNTKKIADFRPLPQNSSLKKRKDDRILTSDVLATNCLQIKECIPTPDQRSQYKIVTGLQYFLAVFGIEQFTSKQLVEQTINNSENWMSIEQAQDFITLYLSKHEADEIKVDSLSVQLTCSLSFMLMTTPVRGVLCNHIQCFGLENYIMAMYSMQPRRWRCPICKTKLYAIQIDGYQLSIINTIKKLGLSVTEIAFDNHGRIMNEKLSQSLTFEFLPPHAIKNTNRIIQLENLSSNTQNIFSMSAPIKPKEQPTNFVPLQTMQTITPTLQNVISNMMLSTNQHLRNNSYANFFAQNYYSNQMKMQQQTRIEEPQKQKVGQNHDSAIVIE